MRKKIVWRRKRQPTPVFLPGKSHGQRSLAGHSPWGRRVRHDLVTKQWKMRKKKKREREGRGRPPRGCLLVSSADPSLSALAANLYQPLALPKTHCLRKAMWTRPLLTESDPYRSQQATSCLPRDLSQAHTVFFLRGFWPKRLSPSC